MPQAQPIIEQLKEEAKGYNRIFVASIHPDLVVNDVQRQVSIPKAGYTDCNSTKIRPPIDQTTH